MRLLDFTGFGMKPLAELVRMERADDIFLADASQYRLTQQWAAWFRSKYPDAAGLRWKSRQHNSSYCYVFFDDVCKGFGLTIAEVAELLKRVRTHFTCYRSILACWVGRSRLDFNFAGEMHDTQERASYGAPGSARALR